MSLHTARCGASISLGHLSAGAGGGPVGNIHPLQAVERVGPLAVFCAIIHTENGAPRWRRVTALRRLLRAQTFLSSAV